MPDNMGDLYLNADARYVNFRSIWHTYLILYQAHRLYTVRLNTAVSRLHSILLQHSWPSRNPLDATGCYCSCVTPASCLLLALSWTTHVSAAVTHSHMSAGCRCCCKASCGHAASCG
jgi:hypothetical protein